MTYYYFKRASDNAIVFGSSKMTFWYEEDYNGEGNTVYGVTLTHTVGPTSFMILYYTDTSDWIMGDLNKVINKGYRFQDKLDTETGESYGEDYYLISSENRLLASEADAYAMSGFGTVTKDKGNPRMLTLERVPSFNCTSYFSDSNEKRICPIDVIEKRKVIMYSFSFDGYVQSTSPTSHTLHGTVTLRTSEDISGVTFPSIGLILRLRNSPNGSYIYNQPITVSPTTSNFRISTKNCQFSWTVGKTFTTSTEVTSSATCLMDGAAVLMGNSPTFGNGYTGVNYASTHNITYIPYGQSTSYYLELSDMKVGFDAKNPLQQIIWNYDSNGNPTTIKSQTMMASAYVQFKILVPSGKANPSGKTIKLTFVKSSDAAISIYFTMPTISTGVTKTITIPTSPANLRTSDFGIHTNPTSAGYTAYKSTDKNIVFKTIYVDGHSTCSIKYNNVDYGTSNTLNVTVTGVDI